MSLAQWFFATFRGNEHTHGRFVPSGAKRDHDAKVEGKSFFQNGPLTLEAWEKHLAGQEACGPVPIFNGAECVFGAVDVDDYAIPRAEILDKAKVSGAPFVVTVSKSGGYHLWLFATEPVPASLMRAALKSLAAKMGLGACELFPKQIAIEPGQRGSYINAPYFGDTRKCIALDQTAAEPTVIELAAEAFQAAVEGSRVDAARLIDWGSQEKERKAKTERRSAKSSPAKQGVLFEDGPPCFQMIFASGGPEAGQRNRLALNVGMYLKKRNPDDWSAKLEELFFPNGEKDVGGFTREELKSTVIKSLKARDYHYQCRESPMKEHCSSLVCRMREFGVGTNDQLPPITDLVLQPGRNPHYLVYLEGFDKPFEISPEALLSYRKVKASIMAQRPIPLPALKEKDWTAILNDAIGRCGRAADEVGPEAGARDAVVAAFLEFQEMRRRFGLPLAEVFAAGDCLMVEPDEIRFRVHDLLTYIDRSRHLPALKWGRLLDAALVAQVLRDELNVKLDETDPVVPHYVWKLPAPVVSVTEGGVDEGGQQLF